METIPQLPSELIEAIISAAWRMQMSSSERITFMRASMLVNSTWADIFDLVSSRDVYIPSGAFCDHFIQRLRAQPPAVVPPSSYFGWFLDYFQGPSKPPIQARSANLACQSITIRIPNPGVHPEKYKPMHLTMGGVLDHLLENLDVWELAPNLRRFSIEYVDTGFDDVFKREGLAALPTQITHLELRYSFNDATPSWLADSLRKKQERQRHIKWIARSVTRLSISGAGENTIQDVLRACPNAQILEVDSCERNLKVPMA
jgi:hypothetical protein